MRVPPWPISTGMSMKEKSPACPAPGRRSRIGWESLRLKARSFPSRLAKRCRLLEEPRPYLEYLARAGGQPGAQLAHRDRNDGPDGPEEAHVGELECKRFLASEANRQQVEAVASDHVGLGYTGDALADFDRQEHGGKIALMLRTQVGDQRTDAFQNVFFRFAESATTGTAGPAPTLRRLRALSPLNRNMSHHRNSSPITFGMVG